MKKVKQNQELLEAFRSYLPKSYWGSVGHILCNALRQNNNDIDTALNKIRNDIENRTDLSFRLSPSYQLVNDASDDVLLLGLKYYALYEQLDKSQKEKLKSGSTYPPFPELIPPTTKEGWIKYYQELLRIQKVRGYKKGWIYHQLKRANAPIFVFNYLEK